MPLNTMHYDDLYADDRRMAIECAEILIDEHNEVHENCDQNECDNVHTVVVKYSFDHISSRERLNNLMFIIQGIMFSSGYYAQLTARLINNRAHIKAEVTNMTPEEYNDIIPEWFHISKKDTEKEDDPKND